MKKLVSIIILCLGCMGILEAQNVWKSINCNSPLLGAASNGDLYSMAGYSGLMRSQDEGETWQVILGYETGFSGYINQSCFAVSNEGRICVFNDNLQTVVYSDDNGDTWQQTQSISSCAMPDKAGLCAPTNDVFVVWAENGEINYSVDGGETWDGLIPDFMYTDNGPAISDLLVNENGDVYVGVRTLGDDGCICHSTISDMQNWGFAAFAGTNIQDMEFDPEGNVVACGWKTEGSVEFQHVPGFYLFEGTSLAIGDGGIVYTPHFEGLQAVLSCSIDHGEHFIEIGEHLPLVDIAPGSESARLFKGADNHLYFDGGGEYWKSISDANHVLNYDYIPLVHEGNQRQKWNVVVIGSMNYPNDYFTEIQSIRDDITLDGVDYKIVWTKSKYGTAKAGAVREEDRRVYYRRKISQNYQDEVLLYDFNLNVGDTVTVNWMGQQLMVMEESEVEVNGTMRRQLGLGEYSIDYPPTEVDEYWIEGVGSTYGFLNSGYEGLVGVFVYLLCYHENGNLVWDNEEFDDCVMNSDGAPATFAPQGAEWYFDVFNPWGTHPEYQRFFVEGDTIIQGHQCSIIDQRFVDTGHDGGEYVYEEDNKVYWFNPTTNAFTTLYDFDAEAGEAWDYEVGDCTHQVIVDSVGSVTWNGHTYRTQWVRYYEENLPIYYRGKIMEGIGYEKGLFPSIEVCNGWEVFDASEIEYLRCYVNDGEMLYHEGGYDCEQTTVTPPSHPEWYYEIEDGNGNITYQHLYQAGDTVVSDEPSHILVRINTLYDKNAHEAVTHEYVFELNGKVYWWNKRVGMFTVLYDYEAQVGDSWNIMVGMEPPLTMHVDGVETVEYNGRTYRMMHVSDENNLFSGDIVCGIGHLTSFFPERLMGNRDGMRVDGLRCYWLEDELVFHLGDENCDDIYSDIHDLEENNPSTGSGTLVVYPNPTDGVLFVETRRATSLPDQTYSITNLMGQTILTGRLTAEVQRIDVSNLLQGMYFITIGSETHKFVVK